MKNDLENLIHLLIEYKKHCESDCDDDIEVVLGSGIFDRFIKSDKLKPSSQKIVDRFGNFPIVKLAVYRTPVVSALRTFLNVISLGKFNEATKAYDDLFHLAMIATVKMPDGSLKNIVMEKNATVNISTSYKTNDKTEIKDVDLKGKNLTIKSMIDETLKKIPTKRFYLYDAFNSDNESGNCQRFIMDILSSNGLMTPELNDFINQKADEIAKNLGSVGKSVVPKVARTLTDIGAMFGMGDEGTRKAGVVSKEVSKLMKDKVPAKIKEAYDFLSSLPKIPTDDEKPILAKTKQERMKLRKEWEEKNKPEMEKILNMSKAQRQAYKKQKEDEYNEYLKKPEVMKKKEDEQRDYGVKAKKMIEKAKKFNAVQQLLKELKKRKTELKKITSDATEDVNFRKQVMQDYEDDMEALQNYDFYAIKNEALRDQLNTQYMKMYNNMMERPKTYGYLPSGRRSDKEYIKYVYENYGKPEPDFLMDVADFMEDFIGKIPVIGDIFKPVNKIVQGKIPDKDAPKKGEELPDVDFTKGYDKYQQILNPEEAIEEQKQLEQQQQDLEQQQKDIVGQGYSDGYALHTVIVKRPTSEHELKEIHDQFIHNKNRNFMKITTTSVKIRNIPKTNFIKGSFRTKKINKKISLVYGKLKPESEKRYLK